jgi:hypothetical protein
MSNPRHHCHYQLLQSTNLVNSGTFQKKRYITSSTTQHVQNRRQTGKKSEVLTESPFKVQLEAQVGEKNKNKKTELQRKRKRITFGKGNVESSKRGKEKHSFPGCTEQFTEPPNEDWIQCGTCEECGMRHARNKKGEILFVTCDRSCLFNKLMLFVYKVDTIK